MGKEEGFVKGGLTRGHPGGCRDPGQGRQPLQKVGGQGEGHEAGPGLHKGEAQPLGNVEGISRSPHLGDRLAAGGQDHPFGGDLSAIEGQAEARRSRHQIVHRRRQAQVRPRLGHPADQEVDHLPGRALEEELAQRALTPGDAGLVQQGDEIGRRVAAEGRDAEPGIVREEAGGMDAEVGEVAPPTAGNADLFAGRPGVVQHQHPPAPKGGLGGTHHAGCTGPDHDDVETFHPGASRWVRVSPWRVPGRSRPR